MDIFAKRHLMKKSKKHNFIEYNSIDKKIKKAILDAAANGELSTYIVHKETGAKVPIKKEAIQRLKRGDEMDLEEAERTTNRYYFNMYNLSLRWNMKPEECFDKLRPFNLPFFFNPNHVPILDDYSAMVGINDVCMFLEYILAVEEKLELTINDIAPEFIGDFH